MKKLLIALPLLVSLSACDTAGIQELESWMAKTREGMKPTTQRIPEPKRFLPYSYAGIASADPFNQQKLTVAIQKATQRQTGGLQPNFDRPKEPLEAFPVDALKMVGFIERMAGGKKTRFATIRADNTLYEVRVGNYLGQNFGQIQSISETEVAVKELVQDATGDWVERPFTLQLQEAKAEIKR